MPERPAVALLLVFGGEPKSVRVPYASSTLSIGPVNISIVLLLAGLATLLVILGLYVLLNRTEIGRAIRARDAAPNAPSTDREGSQIRK